MNTAISRERINAALDAIDAAHDVLRATSSDLVGNRFRVEVAERLETQERANRGFMYASLRRSPTLLTKPGPWRRCDRCCGSDCGLRRTKSADASSSPCG